MHERFSGPRTYRVHAPRAPDASVHREGSLPLLLFNLASKLSCETMERSALPHNGSVDHLYKSLHNVEAACSTVERKEAPQLYRHLDSLKRHLTEFVQTNWPAKVFDEIAEFYTDLARVIMYNLGMGKFERAQKVARIQDLFVSPLPSNPKKRNCVYPTDSLWLVHRVWSPNPGSSWTTKTATS